jgi:hypothetical protein
VNTYTLCLLGDVKMSTATMVAQRIEFPVNEWDTHVKFFNGLDFVGSADLETVYLIKKTSSTEGQ